MEVPRFKIDDTFSIIMVTEENYEEAYNCYIYGYATQNPFFQAIKATVQDIDFCYKQKIRNAFESRPLQQYAVIDTTKSDKIVGVFLTLNFIDVADKQAEIDKQTLEKCAVSEVCKAKYEFDQKICDQKIVQKYIDEINETKNPVLYQQVGISILPEYTSYGFFFKCLYLAFYFCGKLGVKALIDYIYNKVTAYMSVKYCGGAIINDINVKEQTYKGEKVFDNEMCRGQMTYTPLTAEKTVEAMKNDELYGKFYEDCVKYNEYMKTKQQLEKTTLEDAQN